MTGRDRAVAVVVAARPEEASRPVGIKRNFAWIALGNTVYAACQWGMLIVLTKLGSPELVGRFAFGFAVAAPVAIFMNMDLRAIQATDSRRDFGFMDYLGFRLTTSAISFIVIAALALAIERKPDTALLIIAVGAYKSLESLSDIAYGALQSRERMDIIAVSLIMHGLLSVLVLSLVMIHTGSLLLSVGLMATGNAFLLLIYDLPAAYASAFRSADRTRSRLRLRPSFDRSVMARLVRLAYPLGIVMLLMSLNVNIPRYFVERQLGQYELGIFSALSYLMVAGTTVVIALGQSASPRLARRYAAGDRGGFGRLLAKLLAVGLGMGAFGVAVVFLWGEGFLTFFYNPEYAPHVDVLLLLMIASAMGYAASFLGFAATAFRMIRLQVPVYALASVVTAGGSYLLVPSHGLRGAAMAILFGAITLAAAYASACAYGLRRQAWKTPRA